MIPSDRAYQLADAVMAMAQRMASAESDAALHRTFYAVYLRADLAAERDRWVRAGSRRRRALYRLTAALRDLDR